MMVQISFMKKKKNTQVLVTFIIVVVKITLHAQRIGLRAYCTWWLQVHYEPSAFIYPLPVRLESNKWPFRINLNDDQRTEWEEKISIW